MRYSGWRYEQTLLIESDSPGVRRAEFIDARIAVRSDRAENLKNDVRVVLKKEWNVFDREVPCQVYAITRNGDVTTFRVAFQVDVVGGEALRVGVLYDNPSAERPRYESSLTLEGGDLGFAVDNLYYHVETDAASGQISLLATKTRRHEKTFNHVLTPEGCVQSGASIVFAHEDGGGVVEETIDAAAWRRPEIVRMETGSLFFSITRRGELRPRHASLSSSGAPRLETTYKFFADQPYVLVESILEFPSDTSVFAVRNGELCVETSMFSHYTFRPVSPSLPITDIEEMGHVLIDPKYTQGLPEGVILGSLLPYDLAWHAFINIHKGPQRRQYAVTGITLDAEQTCTGGEPALYRAATYLEREGTRTRWYHAPVYVKSRTEPRNIITVPAGSVYRRREVLFFSEWDIERWAPAVEKMGKRLNSPLVVKQYPPLLGVHVPPESPEPLPVGCKREAYLRAGVR